MQTQMAVIGLVLSLAALGVAGYAITNPNTNTNDAANPVDTQVRLDEIDARLARLETAIRGAERPDEPTLIGLATPAGAASPDRVAGATNTAGRTLAPGGPASTERAEAGEAEEQIRELVDEAVTKKAAQIQQMQDKKPSIDAFSKTLALTDAQREVVEREVVLAQQQIRSLLETPTADGTNLLDELVEVMAEGIARPGEKSERGMKWFGRILTEEVPGTGETYAAQAERAKEQLRRTLRQELTEEQHALYESWQMDPSEVQDVPNSPWKDLQGRIVERAKDLGATIPDDYGD